MLSSTATIRSGTASSATTVNMAWRTRDLDEDAGSGVPLFHPLVSDVLKLTGLASPSGASTIDGIHETDPFVLQMSYSPTELAEYYPSISETDLANRGSIMLMSMANNPDGSPKAWVPATALNFGGTRHFLGAQSWNNDTTLGDMGVDVSNHTVWAVVNHDGYFAVPEPSTWTLLVAGFVGLSAWAARRRRVWQGSAIHP